MPIRPRDSYDTPWKRALQRNLPDFMAFYFRDQWLEIKRLSRRPLRDKETSRLGADGRPHTLIADILASAVLHDGSEVLLHIEVQSQRDSLMAERVLDYNHSLFIQHGIPVASFVLLADPGKRWRPKKCQRAILGTDLSFGFSIAKIADYADLLDELLVEKNVFALVTAAHILAQQTHADPDARFGAKWRLVRLLYERGWHKRRIIDLFVVVYWLLSLPREFEQRLWRNIARLERRHKVGWLGPLEQVFIEKGLKQGRREGAAIVLERQLASRFGPPSATVRKRLQRASVEQLAHWSEAVLEAQTLKEVFSKRS